MNKIKILVGMGLGIALLGLVGCASQSKELEYRYKSTPVLYTDLLKAPEDRTYILAGHHHD